MKLPRFIMRLTARWRKHEWDYSVALQPHGRQITLCECCCQACGETEEFYFDALPPNSTVNVMPSQWGGCRGYK